MEVGNPSGVIRSHAASRKGKESTITLGVWSLDGVCLSLFWDGETIMVSLCCIIFFFFEGLEIPSTNKLHVILPL